MRNIVLVFLLLILSGSKIYAQSWGELNIKGSEYFKKGDYKNAIIYFEKGVLQAEKEFGKTDYNYATALNNLAIIYDNFGYFEKAEPLYLEVFDIYKQSLGDFHSYYATSLYNLAIHYSKLGQYEHSEALFDEAIYIFKEENPGEENINYAISMSGLASVYKMIGRYEDAEMLYNDARKILLKTIGENNLYYSNLLIGQSELYQTMKLYEKALLLCKEALRIEKENYGEKSPLYASALSNLAVLYFHMGKYNKSESLYKEAMKILKEIYGEKHSNYLYTLTNLAGLYYTAGENEKAEPLFILSNKKYLDQFQNTFPYLSEYERNNFLKDNYYAFELFYSFATVRYKDNTSIASNILETRLETKGVILNSLVHTLNKIKNSGDELLINKFNDLNNLKESVIKGQELTSEEKNKKGVNVEELEMKAENLEKEFFRLAGFDNSKKSKWKDIKNSLKKNEAAVEFMDFKYYNKHWTDTIYYYALILKPELDNPILVKLFRLDEIGEILSIRTESSGSYVKNSDVSNNLYKIIWQPLEKYLQGVTEIYISPTGVLNKVSFKSLAVSEEQLLIDKYEIKYIGNLKDIIIAKKENNSKTGLFKAAIFGGALYDLDSSIMVSKINKNNRGDEEFLTFDYSNVLKTQSEKSRGSKWGYLSGTLKEAEFIKSQLEKNNYEVDYYTGKEATEESFKTLTGNNSPAILHISTHGFFFPEPDNIFKGTGIVESKDIYKMSDNPLQRSGLILTGANRVWTGGQVIEGVENGVLTAYEVSNMDLQNTELVVLSACETGLGDIKGGEGVYGLQRAFKIAGAKSIIMSLWKVPDKETVELMELFYANWLEKKMTIYSAFNNAQIEMRKKYEPYYWAAFVLVG